MVDLPLTFCVALSLAAFYLALEGKGNSLGWHRLGFAAAGGAVLAKGPVGIVLPALVVLGHRVALRRKLGAPAALLLGAWILVLLVLNRAVAGEKTVDLLHGLGLFTALLLGLLALLVVERRRPAPERERALATPAGPGGPTFVVVPTSGEAENLPGLARRLLALDEGIHLVVVDDASPDETGAIADALARENPGRVAVLHRPGKLGLGTAYLAGIEAALGSGASRVATMDAGLSHEPERLPALLEASGRADVVIGSRYVPGGGAVDSPLSRRLLSRAANLAAQATLGLETRDATAGFRVYRRHAAGTLLAAGVVSSGYSFLLETTFLLEEKGSVVEEVPIRFRDRREGRSKISRGEIGKAGATVARLAARRVRGAHRRSVPCAGGSHRVWFKSHQRQVYCRRSSD